MGSDTYVLDGGHVEGRGNPFLKPSVASAVIEDVRRDISYHWKRCGACILT
jgi:hypothetical protein